MRLKIRCHKRNFLGGESYFKVCKEFVVLIPYSYKEKR